MLLSLTSVPATHISPKPNIGQSVSHDGHDHGAPDRGEVARPKPEKGKALPKVKLAPIEVTSDAQARTLAAPVTNKVGLRALVVAVDGDDFGLATWKAVLDRVGMPYDVVQTRTEALPELLRADGAGKYNAILLTNNSLLYHDGSGFVSGLDAQEWNALWAYERDFAVRQVSLYTAYGSFPEDYCLRPGTENGNATNATLTTQGAPVFDYLKSNVSIPITLSYVYRSALQPGCAAEPILQSGSDVLGVKSTSTDGRERMALTFTSNQYLPQADLLTYGLLRWATRGLMLGERKHYLNVDVDDWFNSTDHLLADGTISPTPFRITQGDASSTLSQQNAFRAANPLASGFKLNIAYNGEGANPNGLVLCLLNLGGEPLSNWSKCNQAQFTWINHTMTHPKMNDTDYTTSLNEINQNLTRAQQMGIPVDRTVLKTGEYSGLGVYHPDPNNDIDPPTDFGLAASNPNLLQAAKDAGVKYLHGNMSFNSHKPSCFNCGIYHPLEQSLLIVPDWPVNVAYHVTNQAEETTFYNSYYGPHGKFPYWPVNQTYTQIVDHESNVGLQHVMSGSVYSHTFHQGNLRNYGGNKNLTFDWINAVVNKYKSYYNVPLVTPNWGGLAGYVAGRNAHFSALTAGADAVYDRTAGTITFTSPANGSVLATNAGGAAYGTDKTATIALTANTPVTVAASPRP
ncbi:hypothetical protein GCM10022248_31030 [Nonomuraea soli]